MVARLNSIKNASTTAVTDSTFFRSFAFIPEILLKSAVNESARVKANAIHSKNQNGQTQCANHRHPPGRAKCVKTPVDPVSEAIVGPEQASAGGLLYTITQQGGTFRYIHVQETMVETRCIGVAEDVTVQILERKRIEHERDYDLLTGVFNRRAFYRTGDQLLSDKDRLGIAVAVMIDLDNLKSMNDTSGHEWGDRYIMAGARCIQEHAPEHALIARVSGDEFSLLFYGFQSQEQARAAVAHLQQGFHESCFVLPDGQLKTIGASGGFCFAEENC